MQAIELNELKKTYKTKAGEKIEALKGVSFEVRAGEIFGFVGPNGAGKSTAIKILVGLLEPSDGKATIFGHACGSAEACRALGFLPEVASYHEFMTARELLQIHAMLAGLDTKEAKTRCPEVLELVGLGERLDSRISSFSKGMKQRFGIAQALVGKPKLLILDELTSGLDPVVQRELQDLLKRLQEEGLTIFFSSHHLHEIEAVCDRVALLHRGELRKYGTLDEVCQGRSLTDVFYQEVTRETRV